MGWKEGAAQGVKILDQPVRGEKRPRKFNDFGRDGGYEMGQLYRGQDGEEEGKT